MSSTNRGSIRQPDDLYVTPAWTAKAILPHLGAPMRVLDPACGDGALLKAARSFWHPMTELSGMDIVDRGWHGTWIRDALGPTRWPLVDLIIANPPYSLAMEFLERAMDEARVMGSTVAFLLRLAWMAGLERAKFHRDHPSDVFVLPRRPSFTRHLKYKTKESRCRFITSKGKRCEREAGHEGECMAIGTDSAEYAWFCFGPGRGGRWQVLDVEERKVA